MTYEPKGMEMRTRQDFATDSPLVICPPDCQIDHDAKWRNDVSEPTTEREEVTMANGNGTAKAVKPLSAATVKKYKAEGKPLFALRSGEVFSSRKDRRTFRAQAKAAVAA